MPAEIRNQIYSLLLVSPDHPISVVFNYAWAWETRTAKAERQCLLFDPSTPIYPAILATNRQIHSESRSILYSQPLTMENTEALYGFLNQIGFHNRALIGDIKVHRWCLIGEHFTDSKAYQSTLDMMGDLRHLKHLRIANRILDRLGAATSVYNEFAALFGTLTAVTGKKDTGADVLELDDSNFDYADEERGEDYLLAGVDEAKEIIDRRLRWMLERCGRAVDLEDTSVRKRTMSIDKVAMSPATRPAIKMPRIIRRKREGMK